MELEDNYMTRKRASAHPSLLTPSYHLMTRTSSPSVYLLPLRKIFCARCPPQNHFLFLSCTRGESLARSSAWDVRALGRFLSTGESDTTPSPAGARSLSAKDVNSGSAGGNRSSDTGYGETGDGDAGGGCAGWGAVLVILLDDDTVLGDVGEDDVLVCDA